MTKVSETQELSGQAPPAQAPDRATTEGPAAAAFFVPDLIQLEVRRGDRVVVVSDLHLAPVASEVSTQAAEELPKLLNGFHQPGMLVIAGDGFEMLAAAPDVAAILDSHPQFTDAVKALRGGRGSSRRADPRKPRRPARLGRGFGRGAAGPPRRDRREPWPATWPWRPGTAASWSGSMHGHQFDQYNAFDDPRSPVDTPLGHHIVRQVLPKLASRDQPGSLLEGVRWCNGDPSAFLGSRLLYRMVAGWLWWLAVPFAAALVLRFLSFAPGVKPLLSHHAERWLVWFGILVVAIAIVAAVTGIATMLRVNRALADASVGERGDAAAHNATVRAEAARLISAGYAGLITGHTHEPELSQVGDGFYANTGCATEVVRGAEGQVRAADAVPGRTAAVDGRADGGAGAVGLTVAGRTPHRSARPPRATGSRPGTGSPPDAPGRRPPPRRSHLADQRAGLDAVGAASPGPAGGRVHAAHRGAAERRLRAPLAGPLDPSGRALAALRHSSRQRRHRRDRRPGSGRSGTRGTARLPEGMGGGSRPAAGQHRLPPGARRGAGRVGRSPA